MMSQGLQICDARHQLDATPAMASQIGDGSALRKAIAHRTAVADFR